MLYNISEAAALANMHPQTLRQYDRLGLVIPKKTRGLNRRYTLRDIAKLKEVQRLSHEEGVNLEGIRRILDLEEENNILRRQISALQEDTIFTASDDGNVYVHTIYEKRVFRSSSPIGLIEF
jgi:MerR family transcriptional regulator/heat shock protein HspR